MIIIVKKRNALLVSLVFVLLLAVYGLNVNKYEPASVNKNQETSGTTEPQGTQKAQNTEANQKVIIVDPGHGGEDPGAVSDYSGIKEKDINLKIAFLLKDTLAKDGYSVIMTREEDQLEYTPETTNILKKRKQDLTRRKKMMDESGADIVVSIHLNKFPETKYFGAQTFYPHNSPESQRLAVAVQNSLKENVDPSNKRLAMLRGKPNDLPIIILRDLKTPTIIVECGFLSNEEDEKKLATDEYQEKIADAIKEGINVYFKKK